MLHSSEELPVNGLTNEQELLQALEILCVVPVSHCLHLEQAALKQLVSEGALGLWQSRKPAAIPRPEKLVKGNIKNYFTYYNTELQVSLIGNRVFLFLKQKSWDHLKNIHVKNWGPKFFLQLEVTLLQIMCIPIHFD